MSVATTITDDESCYLSIYEDLREEDHDATPALVGQSLTHWWPFPCRERATSSNQIHARRVSLERSEREFIGSSDPSFWRSSNDEHSDSNSLFFLKSIKIPINEGTTVSAREQISPLSLAWSPDASPRDPGSPEMELSLSWESTSSIPDEAPDYGDFDDLSFGARYSLPPPVRRKSLLSLELSPISETKSNFDPLDIDDNADLSRDDQSPSKRSTKFEDAQGTIVRTRSRPSFIKDRRRDSGVMMGRAAQYDQLLQFLEESVVVF